MKNLIYFFSVFIGVLTFSQTSQFANLQLNHNNSRIQIADVMDGTYLLNKANVYQFANFISQKINKEHNLNLNYINSEIVDYGEGIVNLSLMSDNGYVTKIALEYDDVNGALLILPGGVTCTTKACSMSDGCSASGKFCTYCSGDCTKTTTSPN